MRQYWPASKKKIIFISSDELNKNDSWWERIARESQGNPLYQHTLIMMKKKDSN